jgi:PIN domain nuclease of toxin-antitoxin system
MITGVADTHTALWYLFRDSRLSLRARDFIEQAAAQGLSIAISSISLAEILYLIEKGRLDPRAYHELKVAISDRNHVLEEASFDSEIVEAMRRVARQEVPDMPDRIVAATAAHLGVPVISRDRKISSSVIVTIW